MEEDLYISRDKLKEILREKLALQNEFHSYERQASQRLDEYQYRLTTISAELQEVSDDNQKLKMKISEQDTEVSTLERARDNFKAQFLELREKNKDLRTQFNTIQAQMHSYMQTKQTEKVNQSDDKEN
jgi:septal ring factor EnvC (AmiA/AmiB activator)